MSTHSIVQSIGSTMTANLHCSPQHCQGSKTGSSVISRINSIFCGDDAPCNPPLQVTFALPPPGARPNWDSGATHFNPYGMPGNNTAPTANTTQTFGALACAINAPHTSKLPYLPDPFSCVWVHRCQFAHVSHWSTHFVQSIAHQSTQCHIAVPVSAMGPAGHSPSYTSFHTAGFPAISTLPVFCGKPVNPAPMLGLVSPSSGPSCCP